MPGVTGNTMQADIDAFKTAGANHVLSKPLQMEVLMVIVNGAITGAK